MTNDTTKKGEAATSLRYKMMELAASMDDVISLGRGDPDLDTPTDIWERALQRLENVMRMVRDLELNCFEAAVFIWSQSDPAARETFDRVFKRRLDFIRNIFRELGFNGDELEMRAQLFMGYLSWEYTDFCPQSKTKQNRLLKLRLKLLTEK